MARPSDLAHEAALANSLLVGIEKAVAGGHAEIAVDTELGLNLNAIASAGPGCIGRT